MQLEVIQHRSPTSNALGKARAKPVPLAKLSSDHNDLGQTFCPLDSELRAWRIATRALTVFSTLRPPPPQPLTLSGSQPWRTDRPGSSSTRPRSRPRTAGTDRSRRCRTSSATGISSSSNSSRAAWATTSTSEFLRAVNSAGLAWADRSARRGPRR